MPKAQKIIFSVIFFISFVTVITVFIGRMEVESQYKQYSYILDYEEIQELSNSSDESLDWWFKQFKQMGAQYISITEETLLSLSEDGKIEAQPLMNVIKDVDWVIDYPSLFVNAVKNNIIKDNNIVVETRNINVYNDLVDGIRNRYGDEFYLTYEQDGKYVVVIKTLVKNYLNIFNSVGLYYDENKIQLAKEAGLDIILRPYNYGSKPVNLVTEYINAHTRYNINPQVYLFAGKEVVGNPSTEALNKLSDFIVDNNIDVVMIEKGDQQQHLPQQGIDKLYNIIGYDYMTRAFTTWPFIQERYKYLMYEGPEEITNTYYRAITERNIRYIYFKPFIDSNSKNFITDVEEYEKLFTSLEERLKPHGITLGNVTPMKTFDVEFIASVLIYVGLVIVALVILNSIISFKEMTNYLLAIIGIGFVLLSAYVIPNLSMILMSICAAIGFPIISVIYLFNVLAKLKKHKKYNMFILLKSIGILLVCITISLIGGLYVSTILADSSYMLELSIFRGVKVSLVIPLLFIWIYYLMHFAYGITYKNNLNSFIYKTKKFLNESIKVKYVVIIGIVAVIGFLYLARTGHDTEVQPVTLEIILRNFLEETTLARPRNKEFLIAYPSFILLIYVWMKKYKGLILPFALAFGIGLTDIVNTFSHIRTPLYLSLARTGYGVIFGIVLGICYLIGFIIIEKIVIAINNNIKR